MFGNNSNGFSGGLAGVGGGMMGTQKMGGGMGMGGSPTFDSLNGGGMDVMGSLKRHSNFGTQFMSGGGGMSPMSMPSGGIFGIG